MRGRTRTWMAITGLLAAVLASAAPARALAAEGDTPGAFRIGLNLVPEPFGKFTVSVQTPIGSFSGSRDTAFAFGLAPYLDYVVHRNVFLGFSPVYSFHIKADGSNGDSGEELDLLIRAGVQFPVIPRLEVFGYLAPGYSIIMVPNADNPSGFVLGFHGGATYNLNSSVFALFQLGYQFGYQSVDSGDAKTEFFQFGLGLGARM